MEDTTGMDLKQFFADFHLGKKFRTCYGYSPVTFRDGIINFIMPC